VPLVEQKATTFSFSRFYNNNKEHNLQRPFAHSTFALASVDGSNKNFQHIISSINCR
jgi:hypothetical protein